MKVLAWVPQPVDTSPGQRFRIEQWEPWLREAGIDLTYSPFSSPELTRLLKNPGAALSKAAKTLAGLTRRMREALAAASFDAAYIFREGALLGPAFAERILASRGVPFIFDFDDSVWIRYISPANAYLSYLRFPGKTATLCRTAAHVFAGNETLRRYALRYNHHVTVVPTTIDTEKYRVLPERNPPIPTIGWTGSYSSEQYLDIVRPALQSLARRHAFRLVVVGGGRFAADAVAVEHRPWRAGTEVADLSDIDIGVMPLEDTEWERGKCGLKALQYMALGIPAVVSPVGVNREIIQHGSNGLIAESPEAWERCLEDLITNSSLRRRLGLAGRDSVEERYSARVHAPQVASRFRALAR